MAGQKTNASKRTLVDGEFSKGPFREDKAASEEAYERAGTTRERVEAERTAKRIKNMNIDDSKKQAMLLETLDDDALEKELAQRKKERGGKKATKVKPVAKTPKVEDPEEDKSVAVETGENFDHLTVPQLKAKLKEKGIPFAPSAKKPKLLELLENDGVTVGNVELDEEEDL